MLPRPVTGFQPPDGEQVKPAVQQVGVYPEVSAQQKLPPEVMFVNRYLFAYMVGLMKPTVPLPAAARCALIRLTAHSSVTSSAFKSALTHRRRHRSGRAGAAHEVGLAADDDRVVHPDERDVRVTPALGVIARGRRLTRRG